MAEVGMQAPTKRKCQREGCPHYIPSWRNGRRVSQQDEVPFQGMQAKSGCRTPRGSISHLATFTTIQRKEVPVKWAFFLTARRPHKMIPRFTMRQVLSEPDLLGNALVTPPLPAWRRLQRVPSSHS